MGNCWKAINAYLSSIDPILLNQLSGGVKEFIKLYRKHKSEAEEVLIKKVCGKENNIAYYYNLKSRTLKVLQALAIVSASKGENEVKKKLDLCRKNFTIGQKFLGKGEKEEGLRLVKQAYKIAVAYDFMHMACELASVLFYQSIYAQQNKKMADHYEKKSAEYLCDYLAEKKAEHHLYRILYHSDKNPIPYKKIIAQINSVPGNSLKYRIYQAMVQILYGFTISDYSAIIQQGSDMLRYLAGRKGVYHSHHQFFYSKTGLAQIALGRYQDAENSFTQGAQYAHPRSVNEALLALYRTINALHAGYYTQAYELYRQNRKCKFEPIKEQFAIIEAYLCFLSHQGYLQLDRKFRLGKYLNETFRAQTDKQGSNVNIIIAELLVYLARNRGKYIDRVEAVNNYSYRHLTQPHTQRAKHFIKILCLLPRANFHPAALRRIAAQQIQFLKAHPIHMGNSITVETIPFEDLLQMIMQQLERKVA